MDGKRESLTSVDYFVKPTLPHSAGAITAPSSPRLDKVPDFDRADASTWKPLLTQALRENFESKGPEIVRQEVIEGRFSDEGKRFAALVWLKEVDDAKDRRDTHRSGSQRGLPRLPLSPRSQPSF